MPAATLAVFLLGTVLVLAVALFVAAPLFQPPAALADDGEPDARARWLRQKRQALDAIRDLELDHRMGKLSDEDLVLMRRRFEAQALEAMAALERGTES